MGVNRPQNNSFINQTGIGEQPGPREQNWNQSQNAEATLQTDYVHPFKNKNTFEAGGKAILRRVGSDFQFSAFDPELNEFIANPRRTNSFSHDQDVVSGYATYSFNWKKFGFKLGSRYEQTHIKADFQSTETAFSQAYGNLIPSATLSRDLTKSQKMRMGYTQRIQRPQIYYLNPFVNYSDTLNLFSETRILILNFHIYLNWATLPSQKATPSMPHCTGGRRTTPLKASALWMNWA